jgi:hypothetical protein
VGVDRRERGRAARRYLFGLALGAGIAAGLLSLVSTGTKLLLLGVPLWAVGIWLLMRRFRHVFDIRWRQVFWRQRVWEEYHSWRLPPVGFWAPHLRNYANESPFGQLWDNRFARLRLLRTPAHRWILSWVRRPVHNARDEDRWRWARSWARTQELRPFLGTCSTSRRHSSC